MTLPSEAAPPTAAPAEPRLSTVTSVDGVRLAVREWGDPAGPPVLLLHGYCQSALCWGPQAADPALAHLRLVAADLRGHGASDKPLDAASYQEAERWADDVAAILDQRALERPVLLGWSYGGRVIGDYLRKYGPERISGLVLVAAAMSNERPLYASSNRLMALMTSADPAIAIPATRAFLRKCFHLAPDGDTFETMLAYNMMVPAAVRAGMSRRPAGYEPVLGALSLPTLVVQGERDEVIAPAMAGFIAGLMPHAEVAMMDETGHTPFAERAERFNALLAAFAATL